jgi:hypothetical protein
MKGTDTKGALVMIRRGYRVSFVHPETKETIVGVVRNRTRDGRIRVETISGYNGRTQAPTQANGLPGAVTYNFEETVYTVPKTFDVKVLSR